MSLLPKVRTWYINYGFLIVGLVLVNVGIINWYLWTKKSQVQTTDTTTETKIQPGNPGNCDTDCVNQIVEARLKLLPTPVMVIPENYVPTPTPTVLAVKTKTAPTSTSAEKTEYVGLPDGGSLVTSDWTSMSSSKWIDTSLYGILVSASWQGWIEMPGGSGTAYARLYDATNGRAVDGSEVSITETEKSSFFSGNISLWRGQNQYYIQVKSTGGGNVNVTNARIKLIVR
jgi:hypothetical protein